MPSLEPHYSKKLLLSQAKVQLAENLLPSSVAKLTKVSKIYGQGSLKIKALDELNLEVNKGDYLAVMGASGSGKSTAMNILGCLDRPTFGTYELNGQNLQFLPFPSSCQGPCLLLTAINASSISILLLTRKTHSG